MPLLAFLSPAKQLLSQAESNQLAQLVKETEMKSSGEIRIYIESHCPTMNPMHRAQFIFEHLQMHRTKARNGVLIYIAFADHDFAILGDRGIFNVAPPDFWNKTAKTIAQHFYAGKTMLGLSTGITHIGELLAQHFPPNPHDRNELPDEIVFGR
ncbi:MAG: TPM domain-containing protein [Chitinophagaceae bacterium]|nr:TPM domain-containing protein [Chitinophagaceae bacterium]